MNKIDKAIRKLIYEGFQPKSNCFVAAAVIGGAVVSAGVGAAASSSAAKKQKKAAGQAADTTLQATRETNALNYALYQQQMTNLSPQLQTQQAAMSALMSGLGLGRMTAPQTGPQAPPGTPTTGGAGAQPGPGGQGWVQTPGTPPMVNAQGMSSGPKMDPRGMPQMNVQPDGSVRPGAGGLQEFLPAGQADPSLYPVTGADSYRDLHNSGGRGAGGMLGRVAGAVMGGAQGAGDAATPPPAGLNISGIGNVDPRNYGASQDQLDQAAGSYSPGSLIASFGPDKWAQNVDPSYDFIMNQGSKSLANYNAAHGISGGQASRDQTSFALNTTNTFYNDAFSRYLTQQQSNISNLMQLAGNGATNNANAAASGLGQNISANTMAGIGAATGYNTAGAAASAAGTVGAANAVSGAIGQGISGYLGYQYLNRVAPAPQLGGPV